MRKATMSKNRIFFRVLHENTKNPVCRSMPKSTFWWTERILKETLWHRVTLEHNGSNPYTSHGSNSQLQKLHALGKHNVCNSVKGWIFYQLIGESQWVGCPSTMFWRMEITTDDCSRWSRVSLPAIGRSSGFSCQIPLDFSWCGTCFFDVGKNKHLWIGQKTETQTVQTSYGDLTEMLEYHIVAIIELKGENKTGSRQMFFSSVFLENPQHRKWSPRANGADGPRWASMRMKHQRGSARPAPGQKCRKKTL